MAHWSTIQERGVVWGMRFLLKVYLLAGRRVLQFFLYPVVSYYWLINRTGREASQKYLQRVKTVFPDMPIESGYWGCYRHFICFANSMIDKLAAWSGALSMDDVRYHGREAVQQYLSQGQGVLMLGSHLGNLEVCRVIAWIGKRVMVNVLVHTRHAEKFNSVLNEVSAGSRMNLIQVTEMNAATAMLLEDKINAGELVIIAADRVPVSAKGRVVEVDFLGQPAMFPQGPFILAALLKCPVFTLFCLKQQEKQHIYFDLFCERLFIPRQQRQQGIQAAAEKYSKILQYYLPKAPLQWFNFYDFWAQGR
jgi:predicted LPLAT superfamily acyltransferase